MKIAVIGHKRIPSREGGIEIVVEELVTRMATRGHRVIVFNRKKKPEKRTPFSLSQSSKAVFRGVEIIEVATVDRRGLAAVTSSFLATLMAVRERPDVIHVHAMGPALMIWIARILKVPTVVTIHGLDWQRAKWGRFASWYLKLGERAAVKWANEIIVLSRNLQDYYLSEHGRQTSYIPNGISGVESKPPSLILSKYGLEADSYLLFVGRIVPEKGLDLLIRAFEQLQTSKRLVIVGGSSDSESYFEKIRNSSALDERILMTGFTVGDELAELFSNSYFYVLPSEVEGMPISLLEAMAYGNCCLISDIQELSEVVANSAEMFISKDSQSLYFAMRRLLDNPGEVQRYRSLARARAEEQFDWEDAVDRTLRLYERAIGDR